MALSGVPEGGRRSGDGGPRSSGGAGYNKRPRPCPVGSTESVPMNNLYRELAPVSAAAWAQIEDEAKRTFALHAAARKAVDVTGPDGLGLAGVGTGHATAIEPPGDGISAALRDWRPVVELRVPFTLSREEIDSVERGALDADWQPVKDAAKKIAFAEDRAVFDGYAAAQISGIRPAASNPSLIAARRAARLPGRGQQGAERTAAGRRGGPVLAAAVRRRVHGGQRDLRPRLPDPRAPAAAARRRHHLGAGDRGRAAAFLPRRRLRAAHRPGPVDRLPGPRRGLGAAVLHRVVHVLRLHLGGERRDHRVERTVRREPTPAECARRDYGE